MPYVYYGSVISSVGLDVYIYLRIAAKNIFVFFSPFFDWPVGQPSNICILFVWLRIFTYQCGHIFCDLYIPTQFKSIS